MSNRLEGVIDRLSAQSLVSPQLEAANASNLSPSPSTTMSTTDERIPASENALTTKKNASQDTQEYQNSLLPIHNVLPTTLAPRNVYYPGLRNLRLVSMHWAALINGTPSFWTVIYCRSPAQEREMALERSKDLPLSVITYCESWRGFRRDVHSHYGFEDQIAPHSRRWESLNAVRGGEGCIETLAKLPAPILRSLKLRGLGKTYSGNIFHGMRSLQHLQLSGYAISWNTHPLVGLLSLELSNLMGIPNADTTGPSYVRILQIITASPKLTILTLSNCLIDAHNLLQSTPTSIELSALKRLTLVNIDPLVARRLLELLHVHNMTHLHIGGDRRWPLVLDQVSGIVAKHVAEMDFGVDTPVLRCTTSFQTTELTYAGLTIAAAREVSRSSAADGFALLVEPLSLAQRSQVTELFYREHTDADGVDSTKLLPLLDRLFPCITSIHFYVDCSHIERRLEALRSTADRPPHFRNLTSLKLQTPQTGPSVYNSLATILRSRSGENQGAVVPLRRLHFKDTAITTQVINDLHAAAPDVDIHIQ